MRTLQFKTLALCTILFVTAAKAQDQMPWVRDIATARDLAAQHNRLVLIHFWAPNCPPCRALEENVFPRRDVAEAVGATCVPVKINASEYEHLREYYNVRRWPTDVIITPEGKEVFRTVSPSSPNNYIALMNHLATALPKPQDQFAQAQAPYGQPPMNPPANRGSDWGPNQGSGQSTPQAEFAGYDRNYEQGRGVTAYNNPLEQPQIRQPAQSQQPYQDAYAQRQPVAPPLGGNVPEGYQAGPKPSPQDYANRNSASPNNTSGGSWNDPYGGNYPAERTAQLDRYSGNPPANPPVENRFGGPDYRSHNPPTTPAGYEQNRFAPTENRYAAGGASTAPPQAEQNPWVNNQPPQAPVAPPAAAANENKPQGNPPIAMDSYCPVTLVTNQKWKKGDPRFGAIHRGRTYLFTSAAQRDQFLANPDKYSPALSGYDAVRYTEAGQLVDGSREHGVFYRDQIFLFSSEDSLSRFWSAPDSYAASVHQAMQQRGMRR